MYQRLLRNIVRATDKTGAFGAIIAALGCASCFPLLGGLAATVGLGFLAQFEGTFINTLLPIFAWLALLANLIAGLQHRHVWRMLAGMTGPALVLLTLYPWWRYGWSTYLFYLGLLLMLVIAIWDWLSPPGKICTSVSVNSRTSD